MSVYLPTSTIVTVSKRRSCLKARFKRRRVVLKSSFSPCSKLSPAGLKRLAALCHFRRDRDRWKVQSLLEVLDDALGLEQEGDMVDGGDVVDTDDLFWRNMAEHGDF